MSKIPFQKSSDNMTNIKHVGYGSGPLGSYGFGGESKSSAMCPTTPKYSGDTVTLEATPRDGIAPYIVEFRINGDRIDPSRLTGETNPITGVTENTLITRTYTLDDLDISSALTGTIEFSVQVSDGCPIEPMTCTESCTIDIGCIAPVCNFTVT
jgi:hypothetical protein